MRISPVDAGAIDLVRRDDDHLVYYKNMPLLTAGGNEIKDGNQRVLKQLIIESCLMNMITDEKVCIFTLLSVCNDFLSKGKDPFFEHYEVLCRYDPFIQLRQGSITASEISKGSALQSMPEKEPVLFSMMFWGIGAVLEAFSLFSLDFKEQILAANKITDWSGFFHSIYTDLHPDQKAVVNLLSFTHNSEVVLPLLLACGYISRLEYVNGLSAVYLRNSEIFVHSPFAVPQITMGSSGFLSNVDLFLDDVSKSVGFLIPHKSSRSNSLAGMIGRGEGPDLEFKSTLRWDLKLGKTNQQVERACLKTISAFLNSNGGVLLIGVKDDGRIEGIESDRFPNTDKFLLHLWTLIRTSFGTDISPNIQTKLETAETKTVCAVKCSRSGRPVFLRQPGFEEEFYIRIGPGTVALAVSEALKYISDHFPKS